MTKGVCGIVVLRVYARKESQRSAAQTDVKLYKMSDFRNDFATIVRFSCPQVEPPKQVPK